MYALFDSLQAAKTLSRTNGRRPLCAMCRSGGLRPKCVQSAAHCRLAAFVMLAAELMVMAWGLLRVFGAASGRRCCSCEPCWWLVVRPVIRFVTCHVIGCYLVVCRATEDDIVEFFSQCGQVVDVVRRTNAEGELELATACELACDERLPAIECIVGCTPPCLPQWVSWPSVAATPGAATTHPLIFPPPRLQAS